VLDHPTHRLLEHLAHVAGAKLTGRFPDKLVAFLAVGTIEEHRVEVRVQREVG
jgi:hypothetical protein